MNATSVLIAGPSFLHLALGTIETSDNIMDGSGTGGDGDGELEVQSPSIVASDGLNPEPGFFCA